MPLAHVPQCREHHPSIRLASDALVSEKVAFGGEHQQYLRARGKDY